MDYYKDEKGYEYGSKSQAIYENMSDEDFFKWLDETYEKPSYLIRDECHVFPQTLDLKDIENKYIEHLVEELPDDEFVYDGIRFWRVDPNKEDIGTLIAESEIAKAERRLDRYLSDQE